MFWVAASCKPECQEQEVLQRQGRAAKVALKGVAAETGEKVALFFGFYAFRNDR
jgi:hypothetical protein